MAVVALLLDVRAVPGAVEAEDPSAWSHRRSDLPGVGPGIGTNRKRYERSDQEREVDHRCACELPPSASRCQGEKNLAQRPRPPSTPPGSPPGQRPRLRARLRIAIQPAACAARSTVPIARIACSRLPAASSTAARSSRRSRAVAFRPASSARRRAVSRSRRASSGRPSATASSARAPSSAILSLTTGLFSPAPHRRSSRRVAPAKSASLTSSRASWTSPRSRASRSPRPRSGVDHGVQQGAGGGEVAVGRRAARPPAGRGRRAASPAPAPERSRRAVPKRSQRLGGLCRARGR